MLAAAALPAPVTTAVVVASLARRDGQRSLGRRWWLQWGYCSFGGGPDVREMRRPGKLQNVSLALLSLWAVVGAACASDSSAGGGGSGAAPGGAGAGGGGAAAGSGGAAAGSGGAAAGSGGAAAGSGGAAAGSGGA